MSESETIVDATIRNQPLLPSQALASSGNAGDVAKFSVPLDRSEVEESYHAFTIDNIGLILQQDQISEFHESLASCQLPNTKSFLHGMVNLRGTIVPVFNLRELFGLPHSDGSYVLVIGEGSRAVAISLSEAPRKITLSSKNRLNNLPPLPEVLRPFIRVGYESEGFWFDCDLFAFFNSLSDQI